MLGLIVDLVDLPRDIRERLRPQAQQTADGNRDEESPGSQRMERWASLSGLRTDRIATTTPSAISSSCTPATLPSGQ
jgi:hypothetical protein